MNITLILFIGLFFLFLIFVVSKSVQQPGKLLSIAVVNSFIGLVILWIVNLAGSYVGFKLPLNAVTVLVTGFLGIPGLAMLGVLFLIV